MQPRPSAETSSPCPSVRVSIAGEATPARRDLLCRSAILARRSWPSPSEKHRNRAATASGDAFDQRRQGERLRDVRESQAPASPLPDLRHVPWPRRRAAPYRRTRSAVIRIAVDAMGGDRGPGGDRRRRARGAQRRRSCRSSSATPALDTRRSRAASTTERDRDGREAGRGSPLEAARPRSSPRSGRSPTERVDAVVSAGNTGAMLAAGPARVPADTRRDAARDRGSDPEAGAARPLLIDAGANADARAEHLLQFATMGAVFAEEILGIRGIRRSVSSRSGRSVRRETS